MPPDADQGFCSTTIWAWADLAYTIEDHTIVRQRHLMRLPVSELVALDLAMIAPERIVVVGDRGDRGARGLVFVWGRQKAREWIGLRTSCGLVTGSPFPPVSHGGRSYTIAQSNNRVAVVRARRITDAMIAAAAYAVAALTDPTGPGAALLPPVTDLPMVSAAVAIAVAQAAEEQGLAEQPLTDPVKQIHQAMWRPEYPALEPI